MPELLRPFSDSQLSVLAAIANAVVSAASGPQLDAIIAAVPPSATPKQREYAIRLASSKFTDCPGALDTLANQYATALSPAGLAEFCVLLSVLSTTAGTTLLTGHLKPITQLSSDQVEKVLLSWGSSMIPALRKASKGLTSIPLFVAYTNITENVQATGYPAPLLSNTHSNVIPSYPFKFEFISRPYEIIDTDVLMIGSGSGGGVAASVLSAGRNSLIIEKGPFSPEEQWTGNPAESFAKLYQNSGLLANDEGSMNILAGSCLGGGSTVNWSASFRLQHFVRAAWAASGGGLPYFMSQAFTDSEDVVHARMGITDEHLVHNRSNQILVDGAKRVGHHVEKVPQNTAGHTHHCGQCGFGCPTGQKQGGTATWLRDAAANGSKFMTGTEVERLLFATSSSSPLPTEVTLPNFTPSASRRRCIGALIVQNGTKAIVLAREAVVVSGGTLNSPAILLRSGLKNPAIGKNLYLHPASFVTAYFDEPVMPFEGAILTAVSNARENVDGNHYGVKIEVSTSFPGGHAVYVPWTGSAAHKELMMSYSHACSFVIIARDRETGYVGINPDGSPRVSYTVSKHDAASLLAGIIAGCEIMLGAGATKIITGQSGVPPFVPSGTKEISDPGFKEWIELVRKTGVHPVATGMGSAHQMGSCRMGTKPSTSVVDPRGRVWGTEGLYIADASVFPSCSGYNPMQTTMAVAHSIARFVQEDLVVAAQKENRANL